VTSTDLFVSVLMSRWQNLQLGNPTPVIHLTTRGQDDFSSDEGSDDNGEDSSDIPFYGAPRTLQYYDGPC
jgi:hypothetical protein